MMTTTLGKNLTAKEQRSFTSYLGKKLDRIEEHLADIPKDALHLRATCEKFPTNAAFKLALELRVDGEHYYVTEDDHTIHEVVDLAIDKLVHQLRTSRDKAQGRVKKSRDARRTLKEEASPDDAEPEPAGGTDRSGIFQMLQPLLPTLHEHLLVEIRGLEESKELARGQLTPEAVTDALVIYLYDHYTEQPEGLSFEQWAEQRATYFLRTMTRSEAEANGWVSLDHLDAVAAGGLAAHAG